MTTVIRMIDRPQPTPTVVWKNLRIASKKSISGWKMLAGTSMAASGSRRRGGTCCEEALVVRRVVSAPAPGIATQHAPAREHEPPEYAELPYRLLGIPRT